MPTMTTLGYTPLDLTDAYTTDVSIFEDSHDVVLGDRILHGLPFKFGTLGNAVIQVPAGSPTPVSVPVGRTARWLTFAHAVLETSIFSGGTIGESVGSYTLEYDDGSTHTHPLRQRFEIGPTPRKWTGHALPLDWGQTPFLALNDAEHELMDRTCGRFDEAGARFVDISDPQSKVPYVLPYRFYLWALENPHPDAMITSVRIEADRQTILVGALTLSDLVEEPFTRTVAETILISLPTQEMTEDVSLHVDRGTSSYVYRTVPTQSVSSSLPAGWGRQLEQGWPHGYAKVSASPSAELTLHIGQSVLGGFTWGELLEAKELRLDSGAIVRTRESGQTWVRLSVRDHETGAIIPCRIHMHTSDGVPVAPYGHHAHINSDGGTWNLDIGGDVRLGAYTYGFISGECEGWLPHGDVTVEISKGFEYAPLQTFLRITPDTQDLELTLQRTSNAKKRGYFSGDTHVHFVSTQGAELEAQAEDVDVVNLLLTQWGHLFTSTEEFTGRPQYSADGRTVVFAGQENRTNMLGHINLLGLKRPIMPWCTGGSEEADLGGGLETTLSHWADECHAQGGTVVLAHFPVPYGETAALLATGRLDAVETIAYDDYNISEYYRYLNAGYRIPIAAGTDKMTSEVPIGLMRTYAQIGTESGLDYWKWCNGIKTGDTFISSGPLLWLTVDGQAPGATVEIGNGQVVAVNLRLESVFPIGKVEVLVNGQVAHVRHYDGARQEDIAVDVTVTEDSWVVARCFGVGSGIQRHNDTWERPVVAHTSPVYVTTQSHYSRFDSAVAQNMLVIVDGAAQHVEHRARRFWPGSATHRHGQSDHLDFLLQPFTEARIVLKELIKNGHHGS